jgi:hypothetical protein
MTLLETLWICVCFHCAEPILASYISDIRPESEIVRRHRQEREAYLKDPFRTSDGLIQLTIRQRRERLLNDIE